jgi:hypothetical protein
MKEEHYFDAALRVYFDRYGAAGCLPQQPNHSLSTVTVVAGVPTVKLRNVNGPLATIRLGPCKLARVLHDMQKGSLTVQIRVDKQLPPHQLRTDYHKSSEEERSAYRCSKCGWIVADDQGAPLQKAEDLKRWAASYQEV